MIRPLPLAAALLLLVCARWVATRPDARRARSLATACVAVTLALVLLAQLLVPLLVPADPPGGTLEWLGPGWLRSAPVVELLVALVAVAFAPAASHGPRTLGSILVVIALALATVATAHPVALALLWVLSVGVVARELRRIDGSAPDGASRPFVIYQSVGVVALAVGTVALLTGHTGTAAIAWLIAIAAREALVPLHGWLPIVAEKAPLGLLVALVAPQPGVYAQLTLCSTGLGSTPAHAFAISAAATGVLAAGIGLVQSSARRAAAWLLISQTSLIAFGLENVSAVGRAGAMLSWQVMALASSGFVMTLAALEARRGPLSLDRPAGSFERTPRMAVAFLLLGFASVALPLTLGYVAEDLLVQGSAGEYPLAAVAVVVATALNGINVLRAFFALFSGTREHVGERDLTFREAAAVSLVLGALLLGGVAPRLFLGPAAPGAQAALPHGAASRQPGGGH